MDAKQAATPRAVTRFGLLDAAAVAIALAVAAILLQTARYVPELGYDESASALGLSLLHGHFGNRIDPANSSRFWVMDCYPPVYYLATAVVFRLAGFGIVQARAVSVLFVLGTALLCYLFARRSAGPAAGLIALAAYMYVPWRVYQVIARPDVAVPFFLLASVSTLVAGRGRGWGWAAGAGALYALALLSHLGAAMIGPVIGVLVLASWPRGRRVKAAGAFAAPIVLLLTVYVWLLYPYEARTLHVLFEYVSVGGSGTAPQSVASHWPLRPLLQHVLTLRSAFPEILYGVLPLTAVVVVGAATSAGLRGRLGVSGIVVVSVFWGAFLIMGAYPNIAIYGYYGPFYLVFAACAVGVVVPALVPRFGMAERLLRIAALLTAVGVLLGLAGTMRERIEAVREVPLSASIGWTRSFLELGSPTLAGPHWVFSAAGDRVLSRTVVKDDDGVPRFDEGFLSVTPTIPPLRAFRTMISDAYDERADIGILLATRGVPPSRPRPDNRFEAGSLVEYYWGSLALRVRDFEMVGALYDAARISSNFSVWARRGPESSIAQWPRIARSTPAGPEEQTLDPDCVLAVPVPPPSLVGNGLWQWRVPVSSMPGLEGHLLVARIVLSREPGRDQPPVSFTAYYPDSAEERAATAALAMGRPPNLSPRATIGIAGVRLATGERGRDLLFAAGSPGADGMLALYTIGSPKPPERVELALGLERGEGCSAKLRRKLALAAGVGPS